MKKQCVVLLISTYILTISLAQMSVTNTRPTLFFTTHCQSWMMSRTLSNSVTTCGLNIFICQTKLTPTSFFTSQTEGLPREALLSNMLTFLLFVFYGVRRHCMDPYDTKITTFGKVKSTGEEML